MGFSTEDMEGNVKFGKRKHKPFEEIRECLKQLLSGKKIGWLEKSNGM